MLIQRGSPFLSGFVISHVNFLVVGIGGGGADTNN
jgi:hypothetical protein